MQPSQTLPWHCVPQRPPPGTSRDAAPRVTQPPGAFLPKLGAMPRHQEMFVRQDATEMGTAEGWGTSLVWTATGRGESWLGDGASATCPCAPHSPQAACESRRSSPAFMPASGRLARGSSHASTHTRWGRACWDGKGILLKALPQPWGHFSLLVPQ